MNTNTPPISSSLPMAATVHPAAEVRRSLGLALPRASAADGNDMMSSEKSARSVCRSGQRKPAHHKNQEKGEKAHSREER